MRALPLLLGCTEGSFDPSRITDVRVVGMVADPPEVGPGDPLWLEGTLADPRERGLDVLVWSCTDFGSGCLEAGVGSLSDWVSAGPISTSRFRAQREVPGSLAAFLPDDSTVGAARAWALACGTGMCPIVETAQAALEDGGEAEAGLWDLLSRPMDWMAELPMEGVSLGAKAVAVSTRPDSERNRNPDFDARFSGLERLQAGEEKELDFGVTDPDGQSVTGWAFTTIGSIEDYEEVAEKGVIRFTLLAPDARASGTVYAVFADGHGGAAVWSMPAEVR